jgi:hypothetical protein
VVSFPGEGGLCVQGSAVEDRPEGPKQNGQRDSCTHAHCRRFAFKSVVEVLRKHAQDGSRSSSPK